uniref:Uncharacterized protein n=1 Tax=Anopheles culicifacies TaxID=139723 RepID=A0A182MHB9_9DIPT
MYEINCLQREVKQRDTQDTTLESVDLFAPLRERFIDCRIPDVPGIDYTFKLTIISIFTTVVLVCKIIIREFRTSTQRWSILIVLFGVGLHHTHKTQSRIIKSTTTNTFSVPEQV